MRSDIIPGAHFPDYELTDHTRTRRSLSELQGNDPMILILSRGHYCPKDHQQHLELAAFYPKDCRCIHQNCHYLNRQYPGDKRVPGRGGSTVDVLVGFRA